MQFRCLSKFTVDIPLKSEGIVASRNSYNPQPGSHEKLSGQYEQFEQNDNYGYEHCTARSDYQWHNLNSYRMYSIDTAAFVAWNWFKSATFIDCIVPC